MLKKILPVVVGLGLFALVLHKADLGSTWSILKRSDWRLCLAALACVLAMIYFKALRWSTLLRIQGHPYPVWDAFRVYMASLFWGNVTPGRAGDFIKVLYLKEDLGLPSGKGLSSVLVDRVFDLYLLLILGCLGLLIYPMPEDPELQAIVKAVWIFIALLVLATLLAFNQRIGGVVLRTLFQKVMGSRLKERTDQAYEDFHRGMEAFYRPAILGPILYSVLSYLVFFWGCSWLAAAIPLEVNVFYLAFTIAVVNIVSLLTVLGMGTREFAFIFLFGLISIGETQALAFDLLFFFVGTILFTALCFLCYLLKPLRWKGAA